MKKSLIVLAVILFSMVTFYYMYVSTEINIKIFPSDSRKSAFSEICFQRIDYDVFDNESVFPVSYLDIRSDNQTSSSQISSTTQTNFLLQAQLSNPFFRQDQILLMNQFFINSDKLLVKIFDFLNN